MRNIPLAATAATLEALPGRVGNVRISLRDGCSKCFTPPLAEVHCPRDVIAAVTEDHTF
jgi:hypothetical protein